MLRLGHVAGQQNRLPAGLADPAGGVLGVLLLAQVADGDVRALARVGDRDRLADAAVRAGDQRDLAIEPPAAAVALLAVVGARVHRLGLAGRPLLLFGEGHGLPPFVVGTQTTPPRPP